MSAIGSERREVTNLYGVIFILFDGEKVQLEKRLRSKRGLGGFIIVPGGGIEKGETEEGALHREVFEEYGVAITFFKKLGVVINPIDESTVNNGNVYLVTNWVGELRDPEKDQQKSIHIEATIPEARALCKHPITQQILDLLEKELSG